MSKISMIVTLATLLFGAANLSADIVISDTFDDGNFSTNGTGIGTFNSTVASAGTATEASGEASFVGGNGGGGVAAIRSVETFDANSAVTVTGVFEVSDFGRATSADSFTTRHFVGFSEDSFGSNSILELQMDGLWIGLQSRDFSGAPIGSTNGEGNLFYVNGTTVTTLGTWTWDQSLVAWDSGSGIRSDRIATDLQDPLTLTLTSDATGYSLGFATTGAGVLPANISGTWAAAGVTNDLSTVHAAVNLQGDSSSTLSLSSIEVSTAVVPEPSSLAVLGFSALGLIARRRRNVA